MKAQTRSPEDRHVVTLQGAHTSSWGADSHTEWLVGASCSGPWGSSPAKCSTIHCPLKTRVLGRRQSCSTVPQVRRGHGSKALPGKPRVREDGMTHGYTLLSCLKLSPSPVPSPLQNNPVTVEEKTQCLLGTLGTDTHKVHMHMNSREVSKPWLQEQRGS